MPAKRDPATARYRVLRDTTVPAAEPGGQGRIVVADEFVDVDDATAAFLVRDGFLVADEKGA